MFQFSENEVIESTLDYVLSCCVLHEMNRQNLVKNGLLDKLDGVFVGNEIQGNVQLTSFFIWTVNFSNPN